MIFQPKLFSSLKNYSKEQFTADSMAGIVVAVVAALPLAIAFAIASGVTPEKGLYTAIIAGFIVAAFGGSRVQIGGPAGSFIVIVYGIVEKYDVTGLAIATLMAGILLVLMGVFKLGTIIKFIPYPVIVGFTSGIAITIFASQVKDLLGLDIDKVPVDFINKWISYGENMLTTNLWTVGIAALAIITIIVTPKISKKIPGSLIAIVLTTVIVFVLREYFGIGGIETIGDRFTLDGELPHAEAPKISFADISNLFSSAFTIAILAAIESLLSATVADGIINDKHDSNTELIAQGIANMVSPIFGGIPATGALARTMTNVNNGARTPIAGIIHAVVLLLILLFLGDLTKHIPMACLAGVLVVVSYNMFEWRNFKALLSNSKSDVAVLLATFLLTVIFDLTIAIQIGLLLAVILFIRRISETSTVSLFKNQAEGEEYDEGASDDDKLVVPKGIEVYEIEGPFFFGIANKFEDVMKTIGDTPNVRIIRMRKVPFIDSTGVHNLKNLIKMSQKEDIKILLAGVNKNVRDTLEKTGLIDVIGKENVYSNISQAMERAVELNVEVEK